MPNPFERPRKAPDTEREPAPFTERSSEPSPQEPLLESGVRQKVPETSHEGANAPMKPGSVQAIEITAPKPKQEKIRKDIPPYTHSTLYPEEGGEERAA